MWTVCPSEWRVMQWQTVLLCVCPSEGSALLRSYQQTMGYVWAGRSGNVANGRRHKHHLLRTNKTCAAGPVTCKDMHLRVSPRESSQLTWETLMTILTVQANTSFWKESMWISWGPTPKKNNNNPQIVLKRARYPQQLFTAGLIAMQAIMSPAGR